MAGLFFCLASVEGAGLLFCPAAIQPHTSVYSAFFAINEVIPPTPQNSTQVFAGAFPVDLLHSSAHNTAATQTAYAPSAPRWRAYHQAQYLHRYQIPPPNRDAVQLSTAAYYNKVYKGAPLLWIHASRCSISQTMPARRGHLLPSANRWQVLHPAHLLRGQRLHLRQGQFGGLQSGTGQRLGRTGLARRPPPGGAVQRQGRGGRRGIIDGYRRISFRAFAR